jgi:DNA repair protein RecO (recombination protein O)
MDESVPFVPTLRACASCWQAIRRPLRNLLHYHCGVRVFKTRQLMLDVQAMTRRLTPHELDADPNSDPNSSVTAP